MSGAVHFSEDSRSRLIHLTTHIIIMIIAVVGGNIVVVVVQPFILPKDIWEVALKEPP